MGSSRGSGTGNTSEEWSQSSQTTSDAFSLENLPRSGLECNDHRSHCRNRRLARYNGLDIW